MRIHQQVLFYFRKKIKLFFAQKILLSEKPLIVEGYEDLSSYAELHIVFSPTNTLSALNALKSFYNNARIYIPTYIHLDGNITEKDKNIIRYHIPFVRFISKKQESSIKTEKFPLLHQLRKSWQGKKLVDTLLLSKKGRKIFVIDDDVFFLRKPVEVINWFKNGTSPIFMQDCGNYCILSKIEMKHIFNIERMKEPLNTGLVGLVNIDINFQELENFLAQVRDVLNQRELYFENDLWNTRNMHLIEQTFFFYLISKTKNYKALPIDDYFLWGYVDKGLRTKPSIRRAPVVIHFPGHRDKVFGWYLRRKLFNTLGLEFC